MKIAITATGNTLDSPIDPRFGRCAWFIIVDPDTMSFESQKNENAEKPNGAGIQSVSFVNSLGVDVVLTGSCGPNAVEAFSSTNIQVHTNIEGTVREAVERFKQNPNPQARPAQNQPGGPMTNNQSDNPGRGMGMGGRRGGGTGRGMGMGGGRGMGKGRRCQNR